MYSAFAGWLLGKQFVAGLALVAQLDRASAFEAGGCRFESCRGRHVPIVQMDRMRASEAFDGSSNLPGDAHCFEKRVPDCRARGAADVGKGWFKSGRVATSNQKTLVALMTATSFSKPKGLRM